MMRSDNLNLYDHGGYTKMTALYSNVNVTNEGKSKHIIVNEKLWITKSKFFQHYC